MKRIINQTDSKVAFGYKGHTYEVEANGQLAVTEEVAVAWKRTHGFLSVADVATEAPTKAEETSEVPETSVEEPEKEEPKAETTAEAPKKRTRVKK